MEEKLTGKQVFTFLIIFLIGETLMAGADIVLPERNEWVAQLAALLAAVVVFMSYMRPFHFFPDKNLFEILKIVLGKIAGKIIGFVFTTVAFLNGVFIMRLVAEFVIITSMETVQVWSLCVIIAILTTLMAWRGISKIGRVAQFCFPVLILFSLFYLVSSLKNITSPIFLPSLADGIMPIVKRSYTILNCPFSQVFFLTSAISVVKSVDKNKKALWAAFIIGGILVVFAAFRNVLVLGHIQASETYFPSYIAATVLEVGDFFKHGEIFVAIVLFCSNMVQIAACIACTCAGISEVFKKTDYRKLALPVGAVMLLGSIFGLNSTMGTFKIIREVFKYFSGIILIVPILFWIIIEIYGRVKKLPNKQAGIEK